MIAILADQHVGQKSRRRQPPFLQTCRQRRHNGGWSWSVL
jgi:hypothetical protein